MLKRLMQCKINDGKIITCRSNPFIEDIFTNRNERFKIIASIIKMHEKSKRKYMSFSIGSEEKYIDPKTIKVNDKVENDTSETQSGESKALDVSDDTSDDKSDEVDTTTKDDEVVDNIKDEVVEH